MASVKTNFGYNLVLTGCNYIFPLITYPYVSRVLGVTNIGVCNFVDSVIQYFVLFSALGVGSFGVREIARYRDDISKRNEIFTNLVCFNAIMSVIAIIVLVICTFTISSLFAYKNFLLLGILKILFEVLLTSWFFQGISDFKYVTIRSVVVRIFFICSVFLFVKSSDDTFVYYFLLCLTVVVNAIINWKHGSKYRMLVWESLNLKKYIIPILAFGGYLILTSMYTTFNTMFLGFVGGAKEVGYFTTATKLYSVILSVFTAFTTVMVPKVSELLRKGEKEKLTQIATDTFSVVFMLSIPIIAFSEVYFHEIILIIAGEGYEGAELPFRIVIFLLLIIGLEQIVIQQFLMASTSNRSIVTVSITGATIGFLTNVILTPSLLSVGSAISWGLSELIVLCVGLVLIKRIIGISLNYQLLVKGTGAFAAYFIAVYFCKHNIENSWWSIPFAIISVIIIFALFNFLIFKEKLIITYFSNRFKR